MGIRKRGEKYQVYVYDPQEQRQISVTCKSLREAEKKEAELKKNLSAETNKKIRRQEKKENKTADKGSQNELTISQAAMLFIQSWSYSKITLRHYIFCFKAILKGYENKSLQFVADNINQIILDYSLSRKLKPYSIRDYQKNFSAFLNWCFENKLLASKPVVKKIKNAKCEHFVPPTQDELARIIEVSPSHIQRVVIIGSQLGVRVGPSELFKMKWSDIDWNRHVLILQAADKNQNEPFREIPLSDVIFSLFKNWYSLDNISGMEYVIHFHNKPINEMRKWKKILLKAGITRRIRPYDLRHAFATEALASGADAGTVAKLMGHSDTTMLFKHYQHVMTKQKQAVMETLSHSNLCQNLCQTLCQEKLQ